MKRKEFFKILDRDGFDRLRVRLEIEKGKLTNLVVQYESLIDNKWTAIVRYDIEHGFFHRDLMTPRGEKIKTPLEISDLNSATIYAEQDIKDKWEHYKQKIARISFRKEALNSKFISARLGLLLWLLLLFSAK